MAFPTGWGRKHEIEIPYSKVDATCTDFPVYLNEDNFDSEIFDADGSYCALNGGGDLRFTSDEAGTSQLPCEVVSFVTDNDPSNGKAEIYVKRSLSSSANTSIYVWYRKSGETQPAADSTYGSENVWNSSYKAVYHLSQDPSGSGACILDSTSNDNHGTPAGTMLTADLVDAKLGKGLDFDGTDDYVSVVSTLITSVTAMSATAWAKSGSNNNGNPSVLGRYSSDYHTWWLSRSQTLGKWRYRFKDSDGTVRDLSGSTTVANDTWYHLGFTNSGAAQSLFVNGSSENDASYSGFDSSNIRTYIGAWSSESLYPFDGIIDEVRITNTALASGWVSTEYNNLSSPSTFAVAGTPESVLTSVNSDSVGKFDLFNAVTSSSIGKFDLFNALQSDSVLKFDIFGVAYSALTGKFGTLDVLTSDIIAQYGLLGLVQSDIIAQYGTRNIVPSDLTGKQDIRNIIPSDLVGKFDARNILPSDVAGKFDARNILASDSIGKFNILTALDDQLKQAVVDMLAVLGGDVFFRPANGYNATIQGAFQRDEPNQEAYVRGLDTATGTLTGTADDLGNVVYGDRFIIDDEWWMLDSDGIVEKNLYLVDISLVRIDE
ncbi:MAG: LamG domain-containing protein [Bacteroidales bacterium]|nr:LamG domain-containing protein [Bacteroidales bacterium]